MAFDEGVANAMLTVVCVWNDDVGLGDLRNK